ncbi:MAG: hypothetical protein LIP03_00025 [Bacteroidales bacterium]|nr:hypothetical protein [Bacteroidales bacterium]
MSRLITIIWILGIAICLAAGARGSTLAEKNDSLIRALDAALLLQPEYDRLKTEKILELQRQYDIAPSDEERFRVLRRLFF